MIFGIHSRLIQISIWLLIDPIFKHFCIDTPNEEISPDGGHIYIHVYIHDHAKDFQINRATAWNLENSADAFPSHSGSFISLCSCWFLWHSLTSIWFFFPSNRHQFTCNNWALQNPMVPTWWKGHWLLVKQHLAELWPTKSQSDYVENRNGSMGNVRKVMANTHFSWEPLNERIIWNRIDICIHCKWAIF